MNEIMKALIKLLDEGVPLSKWIIFGYFGVQVIVPFFLLIGFFGGFVTIYKIAVIIAIANGVKIP